MNKTTLSIKQTASPIRRDHRQRETLIGLGLNRIGKVVERPDTPEIRGMIAKVRHLVRVTETGTAVAEECKKTCIYCGIELCQTLACLVAPSIQRSASNRVLMSAG